jgi:glycerol kinase
VRAAHIVRATLEAVGFQTGDLIGAMRRDSSHEFATLRVDSGMTDNDWLMQSLADLTGLCVERAANAETTAAGVAYLAGMQAGLYGSLDDCARLRRSGRTWQPGISQKRREAMDAGWQQAIRRSRMTGG